MPANVTIYCLENITDYFGFERLCHDLMSLEGYPSIEPLGGFSDKGRDAIHVDRSGKTTIFAYSVREDWRAKLAEDASKIRKYGHTCDQFYFITTAQFTPGERDEANEYIRGEFSWNFELFGVERLRILLDITHPRVKSLHPQIFPPALISAQADAIPSTERDHVFVSYDRQDAPLADWLTRKLTAEGYLAWCEHLQMLGTERYPDDVEEAIRNRTFCVVGLYSQASLRNPDTVLHQNLALSIGKERQVDFLIPLNVDGVQIEQLDHLTRSVRFVPLENSWAKGLQLLLQRLESIGTPKILSEGKGIAAAAFLERDVLSGRTESLYSNCLRVERIPKVVRRFEAASAIPSERLGQIRFEWACRKVGRNVFLSFHDPPLSISNEFQIKPAGGISWPDVDRIDGIWSANLVSELLKKALVVKCHEKGLRFCPHTHLHFFPSGLLPGNRLNYTRPDGSKTYVRALGQRKFWRPTGSEEYQYSLAPAFSISQNLFDDFVVLVRLRVRLTNRQGEVLPRRTAISRRKHLCKDWWNDDWLNRVLAVCHYLADQNRIIIGKQTEEQIIVDGLPLRVEAPTGIDEAVLDRLSHKRSELLAAIDDDESDDGTVEERVEND